MFFFFKPKTAYEMRISDWSSDVCSSDLPVRIALGRLAISQPSTTSTIRARPAMPRSEEHTSELQSLMRISYAVFCLKKKKQDIMHISTQYINHQLNRTKTKYIVR